MLKIVLKSFLLIFRYWFEIDHFFLFAQTFLVLVKDVVKLLSSSYIYDDASIIFFFTVNVSNENSKVTVKLNTWPGDLHKQRYCKYSRQRCQQMCSLKYLFSENLSRIISCTSADDAGWTFVINVHEMCRWEIKFAYFCK